MSWHYRTILASLLCLFAVTAGSRALPTPSPARPMALPSSTLSPDDPVAVGQPAFHIYNDQAGLPQNSIQSIAFDASGYLWVATQDGAAVFNGRAWKTVNMPNRSVSNYVNTVCATEDGSLWFGTDKGGISRLSAGNWTTFSTGNGLPNDTVRALVEMQSESGESVLWAGTAGGLARFERGAWTTLTTRDGLPSDGVKSLAVEPLHNNRSALWVGTDHGLARLQDGKWTSFGTSSGLPSDSILCVYVGPDIGGARTVWAGTPDGLARYGNGTWSTLGTADGLPDSVVRSVLETVGNDGVYSLWVGTIRGGLARWKYGRWMVFGPDNGFSTSEVSTLYESRTEGGLRTLWIGLNGGGLAQLDEGRWLTFDQRSGLPSHNALSFGETLDEDGRRSLWFGTRAGLAHFKDGTWRIYTVADGLPGPGIRCILQTTEPDGERVLWVGTSTGLGRLARGTWSILNRSSGLPGDEILSLLDTTDPDGRHSLWVSTGSGLARLRGDQISRIDTSMGLPHDRVQCVVESTSAGGTRTLWIGTDNGLARFEDNQWRIYTTADGLANNVVLSLMLDATSEHPALWVGTYGGASRIDITNPDAPVRTITDSTTPALPNNAVYGIRQDARHRLYFFTNKGVARLTPRTPTADDRSDYAVYTFTRADGLPGNECDIGASMVDSRGRIWVGTVNGIGMLDPAVLPDDKAPKPLRLEQVLVNDAIRPLDPNKPLAYDENNLVFEYALLSFFRGADTVYRTQLVGLEDDPSPWSTDAKRVCSNLPAGGYTLRVWARDYAGNISGPVLVPFHIRPAPWHTWWAYALYVLLVVGAGYALFRYRTEALRRRNEMLTVRVEERTVELAEKVEQLRESEQRALEASHSKSTFLANMSHELRTPLNAILGFVQLMERASDRPAVDREYLSIIARSGEHLLGLINDVLSLSKIEAGQLTRNDRAFDLPGLLRNLEELFRLRAQAKNLQLLVELDPELPTYVYGDDGKLRQVLINLLGNAFKFTEAGGVAVRVRADDGICTFEVEDTGPGISKAELAKLFDAFVQTRTGQMSNEGTGLGLAISRSYVRLMGGEILVSSEEGSGTRFTFTLPLPIAEAPAAQPEELRVVGLATNQPAYRVLVADDKWENRHLLARLLLDVGFQVQEASTGVEAVTVWSAWRPEIVWMDIQMPEMNGYDATKRIRELEGQEQSDGRRRTCVMAVTASAFAQERSAILEAGCDDYVSKPFRNATIFEKMAEHAGVRFVYGQSAVNAERAKETPSAFTQDRLKQLPTDLVERLNRAVVQGDIEQAFAVTEEIVEIDADLGSELRSLVRSYRFDDILERVGKP